MYNALKTWELSQVAKTFSNLSFYESICFGLFGVRIIISFHCLYTFFVVCSEMGYSCFFSNTLLKWVGIIYYLPWNPLMKVVTLSSFIIHIERINDCNTPLPPLNMIIIKKRGWCGCFWNQSIRRVGAGAFMIKVSRFSLGMRRVKSMI